MFPFVIAAEAAIQALKNFLHRESAQPCSRMPENTKFHRGLLRYHADFITPRSKLFARI